MKQDNTISGDNNLFNIIINRQNSCVLEYEFFLF